MHRKNGDTVRLHNAMKLSAPGTMKLARREFNSRGFTVSTVPRQKQNRTSASGFPAGESPLVASW